MTILSAELDIEVVEVGDDGSEALELYERSLPDILMLDIQMKEMGGLEAAQHILAKHRNARVVFLTTFADDEYIVAALRMGAKGYLIKQEVETIAPALRSVMAGQSVMGGEVLQRMDSLLFGAVPQKTTGRSQRGEQGEAHPEGVQPKRTEHGGQGGAELCKIPELSQRENEIVKLVAQGLDNKEIAARLFISEGTTRNHVSTILAKLALKNRTQLAIRYYQS